MNPAVEASMRCIRIRIVLDKELPAAPLDMVPQWFFRQRKVVFNATSFLLCFEELPDTQEVFSAVMALMKACRLLVASYDFEG